MSDPQIKINVSEWVDHAEAGSVTRLQRQATEIILNAIAAKAALSKKMFLKGGLLMGLAYDSPRRTTDIDLTTSLMAKDKVGVWIKEQLNQELSRAAARLGYARLIVRAQSAKWQQGIAPESAKFPALEVKAGYAERGTTHEKSLSEGQASQVINIDVSFNECMGHVQILELTGGQELFAYGLVDLIAEKYRAVLQQVPRNRNRRQDIFDLDLLIAGNEIDDVLCTQVLDVLIEKCRSRHLEPMQASLSAPEVKERSGMEWEAMELEVGELPDFEDCYSRVSRFYKDLPWDECV